MTRWMTVFALLAAPTLAQDVEEDVEIPEEEIVKEEIPEEEIVDEKEFVEVPAGRLARGERDAPALFVRVREAGVLQVKVGDAWKDVTLKGYAEQLRRFAEEQEGAMAKEGKSAFEMVPGGAKVSRLFVAIDAEPTVPWQQVQWLMVIAAEQKHYKLELSDGTRRLLAFLPVDRGVQPVPREPRTEIKVSVHAVARAEKPVKWGDVEVMRPTEVRYKMGDEETTELWSVADYMRKARKAIEGMENTSLVGEIKAGHKVPFAKVFDVMETFEAQGIGGVNFSGTAIPGAKLREAPRLPYPLKNYETTD